MSLPRNDVRQEIGERRRVSNLLKECSISERLLRERLEATEGDGDLKARLASTRAELDAVRREKDSLVSNHTPKMALPLTRTLLLRCIILSSVDLIQRY